MTHNDFRQAALAMSAYEPIEGEYRDRAHQKWKAGKDGINFFGFRWRYREEDAGHVPCASADCIGVEIIDQPDDGFPLDILAYSTGNF